MAGRGQVSEARARHPPDHGPRNSLLPTRLSQILVDLGADGGVPWQPGRGTATRTLAWIVEAADERPRTDGEQRTAASRRKQQAIFAQRKGRHRRADIRCPE